MTANNNNSSTSNVASGSDDTSRWEEAAMGKQTAEGGIWVPKSQGSSGSAGEGTERQISTPLRRNQGPKVNQVTPVDAEKEGCDTGKVEYMVESPDNAVEVEEATVNKPFHRLDGRTVDVPFMRSWSSQFIAVHQGFKVLKLRYQMAQAQGRHADRNKRTQFSMCIFLPDALDGLPRLVDMIASQPGFLDKFLPKKRIHIRQLRVPKFKLSFHNSVITILKKLGLELPFSEQADLSDMVERDESTFWLSQRRNLLVFVFRSRE
ncbi:hypothetical protein ZWY2020_031924 [Hordeum vulgare]|nr:hypothetical protein ZWY2020_031924 [Hordeum vulgare]